ncbi:MAG: hypothetical protein ACD_79C01063G0002 [uncultured bacterium]|nr:MAG: hypothetical protein ACD_79C01063G0002 [uncultured bacterium]
MNEINETPKPAKKVRKTTSTEKKLTKTKKTRVKKTTRKTSEFDSKNTDSTLASSANPFHSFSEKTTKIFDSIIDDVKKISQKTTEFSKNSQIIDSITNLINKTKNEFLDKKKEFTEIHNLNTIIASNKRKFVEKTTLLGKKTFSLIEQSKIAVPELNELFKEISEIKETIKINEAELKKLLEHK